MTGIPPGFDEDLPQCASFNPRTLRSRCDLAVGHEGPHKHHDVDHIAMWSTLPDTAMKKDKLMMELVDLEFVADMARQLQGGLVGDRVPNGWKDLDPLEYRDRYIGAVMRHMAAAQTAPGTRDPNTGATHWAAVAVNAMILWYFERAADTNQPCKDCGKSDGTFPGRGFARCNACGYPGQ